jgi:putative solute:sodium symporter small subunit
MPEISQDAKLRHWARTRNLTMWVLVVWFIFSFVIPWFAGPLNAFSFIGFPLGYYMIVQGSLIVFVVLIFFQNWKQDQIDDEAGVGEK